MVSVRTGIPASLLIVSVLDKIFLISEDYFFEDSLPWPLASDEENRCPRDLVVRMGTSWNSTYHRGNNR